MWKNIFGITKPVRKYVVISMQTGTRQNNLQKFTVWQSVREKEHFGYILPYIDYTTIYTPQKLRAGLNPRRTSVTSGDLV